MLAGCSSKLHRIHHAHLTRRFTRHLHTPPLLANISSSTASSTVNADEIAHFSRLSSLWWDERGEFGMLHKMNPVRVQYVKEKLAEIQREETDEDVDDVNVLRGLNVLDVGCGGGLLSESLARMGANTLGIDASASNISIASWHASADPGLDVTSSAPVSSSLIHQRAHTKGKGKLTYENTSVEELLARHGPASFDVVCFMEVLEHVDNPRAFLSSCAQLTKPGGHIFLSSIARNPLSYFLTIFTAEKLLRFVEPGTHTYTKYVNPSELISFFQIYRPPSSAAGSRSRPWIGQVANGVPARVEAETRGIIYVPWRGEWRLSSRGENWSEWCNYLFWVRRPKE